MLKYFQPFTCVWFCLWVGSCLFWFGSILLVYVFLFIKQNFDDTKTKDEKLNVFIDISVRDSLVGSFSLVLYQHTWLSSFRDNFINLFLMCFVFLGYLSHLRSDLEINSKFKADILNYRLILIVSKPNMNVLFLLSYLGF